METDPYNFDNERGWRIPPPGWGMYYHGKRRLLYYRRDITEAWTYRTFAESVRICYVELNAAQHSDKR